jgi:hypothetical protein
MPRLLGRGTTKDENRARLTLYSIYGLMLIQFFLILAAKKPSNP